jgi:hypothetical protein
MLGRLAKEKVSRAFSSRPFHRPGFFSKFRFVIKHAELELSAAPLMRLEVFAQANSPKSAAALLQDPAL